MPDIFKAPLLSCFKLVSEIKGVVSPPPKSAWRYSNGPPRNAAAGKTEKPSMSRYSNFIFFISVNNTRRCPYLQEFFQFCRFVDLPILRENRFSKEDATADKSLEKNQTHTRSMFSKSFYFENTRSVGAHFPMFFRWFVYCVSGSGVIGSCFRNSIFAL